uniref:mannan endo-1,4-beta-mannosidase n=1 Tax=Tetradesmus obliquus TaxID=3088 RepID=A0A383VL97_TETOB
MSSSDLQVVVQDIPADPVKPAAAAKTGKLAGAAAASKQLLSTPKGKALAGLGLLCVLLPAIVVPAAVASQKNKQGRTQLANSNSRGINSQTGSDVDPNSFVGADGQLTTSNTTLKVPTRTLNKTKDAVAKKTFESETWTPYVKIANGQFDENCRPFYPTGFNAFELTTMAATGRKSDVDAVFKNAASMGMTSARTWAHSISEQFPFQTAPGKYDEQGLQALDYVIDSASRHGIRLILSFIDNWKYYNGVDQYVDWCGPGRTMARFEEKNGGDTDTTVRSVAQNEYETLRHALFFKEEACKALYKDHVDAITGRKNSINGLLYKNDPTILAWNLINEPRCETWMPANSWCPGAMSSWFKEMGDYVRSKDPNHLVSSGSEGFFGQGDANQGKNPQPWAAQTGQNFVDDNRHMDFAVAHAWPDNWEIPNEQQGGFLREWLASHLEAAESIGMPLLFEEFGKKLDSPDDTAAIRQLRDPVFGATYDAVQKAVEENKPLLGSLYWKWAVPGLPKGPYGVDLDDSTMGVIKTHANVMHRLVNAIPPRPGCVLPASPDKKLGAWFASAAPNAAKRGCVNAPEVSLAYYNLYGPDGTPTATAEELELSEVSMAYAKALYSGKVQVYPTRLDCCRAGGLGAYPQGCNV